MKSKTTAFYRIFTLILVIGLSGSLADAGTQSKESKKGEAKSSQSAEKSGAPKAAQDPSNVAESKPDSVSNSATTQPDTEPSAQNVAESSNQDPASGNDSIEMEVAHLLDEWFDNKRWFTNVDDTGSVFDPLDQHFGDVVVTPVQSVLFYDVYYFDNERQRVFNAVGNLKSAVSAAEKKLKATRVALGIDPSEASNEEQESDKKKPAEPDYVKLRNDLKEKIRDAFAAILASKIPTPEIKATFIAIKEQFFRLDFRLRNSKDGKLTREMLTDTVKAISKPVGKMKDFTTVSHRDLAWALNPDITADDKTALFRGFNIDQINQKIDSYDAFDPHIEALVKQKLLDESNGVYSVHQKEEKKGDKVEMVDAKFVAISIPFIVLWLVLGAIYFTIRMFFINIRGFVHAIRVTRGDYDDPKHPGEISHFQALSSALSATVGLGNIAGVAIAVSLGGPGAIVWMVIAGFLGMTSKFTECTLGQMYRRVDEEGRVLGGPMRYLSAGLAEMNLGLLGKVLAVMFVILCIGGSFGGGNMFQANQSYAAVKGAIPWFEGKSWLYGIILAFIVALVILGGIKRIGSAAGIIVPFMCLIYVVAGLFVILWHISSVPAAFGTMLGGAFSFKAGFGGLIGTLVVGFQRAAFSNEAGTGSASIAHSAASTDEPVREGIVALLEPFIDTIVVCTMTGLVVVISEAYKADVADGVAMTSLAFSGVLPWFPYVLTVAVVLFAFSTMISWSYYGERCAIWLFGDNASVPYKFLFLIFVFLGSVMNLNNVLGFSDLMILGMAFPNVLGLVLLSGKVRRGLDEYWGKLENGEFDVKK